MRVVGAAGDPAGVAWADGRQAPADAVIFATGYRPDVPFLAPEGVFDANGRLAQKDGVSTRIPGLFFVGQPGLRRFGSATLRGVGADAAVVAGGVARFLRP